MSLTDEKKRLYEVSMKLSDEYGGFEVIDKKTDSYFKAYGSCKHLDENISAYASDELSDLRNMINELWADEQELKKNVMPIMLMAYNKTKNHTDNYLEEISLINYMM